MTAPVERKLHGVTLRPREYFAPKVPVGPQTAAQKEEMLRAVRSVITEHRKVLEALKDR